MGMVVSVIVLLVAFFGLVPDAFAQAAGGNLGIPKIDINVGTANSPQDVSKGIQILVLMTVLTIAPSIFIMTTAFTRIVIVLAMIRQAMGLPQMPPNQILLGLSLILTFFVMSPTLTKMNETGLQPYLKGKITQEVALTKAMDPMRGFMFKQTREPEIELFMGMAKLSKPKNPADVPTHVLIPAFIISELKIAFQLGFLIFLPFLIIDVVVASILVSLGMIFLPPATISMPFKLVLFVLVDGWHLITKALVSGFN
ncbi:MAG: flagellar type III secretion system pore protein FliP [Cyanobacteria bacterium]|nr:flagellar type III secretion system pore protein FliP [Cyanobacteriota bacterium]